MLILVVEFQLTGDIKTTTIRGELSRFKQDRCHLLAVLATHFEIMKRFMHSCISLQDIDLKFEQLINK